MEDNVDKTNRILKFLYYLIGVQIAVFGFIVSKLIDLEYNIYNYFLLVSLISLSISIVVIFIFIMAKVFRPNEQLVSNKRLRLLTSFIGSIVGLALFGVLCWLFLFKGYINF